MENATRPVAAASASPPPILLEGTIVTMNSAREVIHNGHVLVRDGRIAAMWKGAVIKFNKARMILGGTTTTQGTASHPAYDSLLARNVGSLTFGRQRIFSRVRSIGSLSSTDETVLKAGHYSSAIVVTSSRI